MSGENPKKSPVPPLLGRTAGDPTATTTANATATTTSSSSGSVSSQNPGGCRNSDPNKSDRKRKRRQRSDSGSVADDFNKKGNSCFERGKFMEALFFYEKAIAILPTDSGYHFNRSMTLLSLDRVAEATIECTEAVRLDPNYANARHQLGALLLRLGLIENARKHICFAGVEPDPLELRKLLQVEKYLINCGDFRELGNWIGVLTEVEGAIVFGANASPQLFACKAEASLKLGRLEDANYALSFVSMWPPPTIPDSQSKIFGMDLEAYPYFVKTQVDLASGRFYSSLLAIEKAKELDPEDIEITGLLKTVRLVGDAHFRGYELFLSDRFADASEAYGDGLRLDPSNSVLYCNRADCWYSLAMWERSVDDCSHALSIQPGYTKALMRRAASNFKLKRWEESVRDYEALSLQYPDDIEIAKSLFHAHIASMDSRGDNVDNMKFGGDVETVSSLEQLRAQVSYTGASVVHFKKSSSLKCQKISPFVEKLCTRFPSINFLKVDIEGCPEIAESESVTMAPTFMFYKKGICLKQIISPSPEVLESSVRHYYISDADTA